jgi:hypothetical protein
VVSSNREIAGGSRRARWPLSMGPNSSHPPLARAFLALSDEPSPPPRPSLWRACGVCAAALVLGLAAPVAWASAADHPAATPATKMAGVDADEDDEDGDGAAPPADDDGAIATDPHTWTATDA